MKTGWIIKLFFFSGLLWILVSCSNQYSSDTGKVKIIFDTDMGSDCDDVGALALLHYYADMGKADIIGCIYSSGKVPYGAGIVDAINKHYNRPDIHVGACYNKEFGDPVDKMNAEKLAKDTAQFKNKIIYNTNAEEQTALNRRLLVSQKDNSIVYITVGHTKALYDLIVSKPDKISPLSGEELIKKKIIKWVALGALNANNKDDHHVKDWNFCFNSTAPYTKYLVDNFPQPVYFVNGGRDVMTGQTLKNTPDGNIIKAAYTEWLWNVQEKTLDDQRPSWDIVTVYYAVEGTGDYFYPEEKGRLDFDTEKGSLWISGEREAEHFYVQQKEGVDIAFSEYLNELIAISPEIKK